MVILADAVWREALRRRQIGDRPRRAAERRASHRDRPDTQASTFRSSRTCWQPMAQAPALAGDGRDRRDRRSLTSSAACATTRRWRARGPSSRRSRRRSRRPIPAPTPALAPTWCRSPEQHYRSGDRRSADDRPGGRRIRAADRVRQRRESAAGPRLPPIGVKSPCAWRSAPRGRGSSVSSMIESLLLSAMGGAAGLVLAVIALRFFTAETADMNLPLLGQLRLRCGRVRVYRGGMSRHGCFARPRAGVAAGADDPARSDESERRGPRDEPPHAAVGGRPPDRRAGADARPAAGAGLLVRSGLALADADAVLDMRSLPTARIALPPRNTRRRSSVTRSIGSCSRRLDAASPAIASATLATARPFVDANVRQLVLEGETFTPENPAAGRGIAGTVTGSASGVMRAAPRRTVQMVAIGDRYFETLGLTLRRGRGLTRDDARPVRKRSSSTNASRRNTSPA